MTFTPPVPPVTLAPPRWLHLSAIAVMVVAGIAMLAGLGAEVGVLMSRLYPFASLAGSPPEMARMVALQRAMMAGPAPAITIVLGVASLLAGAWALYCAIRVLSGKSGARAPFRTSVFMLAMTESASMTMGVWQQSRNFEPLRAAAGTLVPGGASPSGFDATMSAVMKVSALFGLVLAVGFGIVKLAALAWAHRYTGTKEVSDYLDR